MRSSGWNHRRQLGRDQRSNRRRNLIGNLANPLLAQLGYAQFGLLCLQLGDVIAENWRGKNSNELFKQKKKFPIPVIVRKN
jgi:hypothetical protein